MVFASFTAPVPTTTVRIMHRRPVCLDRYEQDTTNGNKARRTT
jgi:hypothetical protein